MREPLRERWELFARQVVEGATYKDAALAAGYSSRRARQVGSELANRPAVKALINQLQIEVARRHDVTMDSLIRQFDEDRLDAKQAGQHSAAVEAGKAKAKIAGLWVDKVDANVRDHRTDAELDEAIDARMRRLGYGAKVINGSADA